MTEVSTSRPSDQGEDDAVPKAPDPNVAIMVLGAALAVLAPLAGFLGGSIVGSTPDSNGTDPMFLWLFGGLVVGGLGAVVVFLGGMRWFRAQRDRA